MCGVPQRDPDDADESRRTESPARNRTAPTREESGEPQHDGPHLDPRRKCDRNSGATRAALHERNSDHRECNRHDVNTPE